MKVNRKARRGALRSALSEHAGRGSVAVFDAGRFDAPSTAQAAELLDGWAEGSVVVLLDASEEAAGKSFRNIARVNVMPVGDAGVADVIGAGSLLVSEAALPTLVALAGGAASSSEEPAEPAAPAPAEETSTPPGGDELEEAIPRDDAPEIEDAPDQEDES